MSQTHCIAVCNMHIPYACHKSLIKKAFLNHIMTLKPPKWPPQARPSPLFSDNSYHYRKYDKFLLISDDRTRTKNETKKKEIK